MSQRDNQGPSQCLKCWCLLLRCNCMPCFSCSSQCPCLYTGAVASLLSFQIATHDLDLGVVDCLRHNWCQSSFPFTWEKKTNQWRRETIKHNSCRRRYCFFKLVVYLGSEAKCPVFHLCFTLLQTTTGGHKTNPRGGSQKWTGSPRWIHDLHSVRHCCHHNQSSSSSSFNTYL